jgi:3',5'-cyclic-AMP phosphodiesterase
VKRAAKEVQEMNPPADFLIFGGDLAQLGRANELALGVQLLSEIKARKVFIPGEHDWYYDMGKEWMRLFDKPNWTFDHKGVRFVGLDTVSRAPDYWTARKMSPEERMDYMSDLDGSVAGPWAGVGRDRSTGSQRRSPPGTSPGRSSSSVIIRSTSTTRLGTSGYAIGAMSTLC